MDNLEIRMKQGMDGSESLSKPYNWLTKVDDINQLVSLSHVIIDDLAKPLGGKMPFIRLLCQSLNKTITPLFLATKAPFSKDGWMEDLCKLLNLESTSLTRLSSIIDLVNQQKKEVLVIIENGDLLPAFFLDEIFLEMQRHKKNNYLHLALFPDFFIAETLCTLDEGQFCNLIHSVECSSLTVGEIKKNLLKKLALLKALYRSLLERFYDDTEDDFTLMNNKLKASLYRKASMVAKVQGSKSRLIAAFVTGLFCASMSIYFWQNTGFINFKPKILAQESEVKTSPNISEIIASNLAFSYPQCQRSDYSAFIEGLKVAEKKDQPELNFNDDFAAESYENSNFYDLNMDLAELEDGSLNALEEAWENKWPSLSLTPEAQDEEFLSMEEEIVPEEELRTKASYRPKHKNQIGSLSTLVPIETKETSLVSPANKTDKTSKSVLVKILPLEKKALSISEGAYTIQLLASLNKEDLQHFIAKHGEGKDLRIYTAMRNEVNWFVLTLGEFKLRGEANRAIGYLPKSLAQAKPWIRSLEGLKSVG